MIKNIKRIFRFIKEELKDFVDDLGVVLTICLTFCFIAIISVFVILILGLCGVIPMSSDGDVSFTPIIIPFHIFY